LSNRFERLRPVLFHVSRLDETERRTLKEIVRLRNSLRYAVGDHPRRWHRLLRRSAFARALTASVEVAGYGVTVDDAIVALEGGDPLETHPWDWAALGGCRSAMTYVLHLATDPHFEYSTALIRALHFMISHHELGRNPGRWRPGAGAVRGEVGDEVIYDAPHADLVPALVAELVQSILPENAAEDHPIVVAAVAHLNLALIRPFSEGNGRMARCLQALILARDSALPPQFSSIEEYIAVNAQTYRDVLAEVAGSRWQPRREVRAWLRFCLSAHLWQANNLIRRARETERLWELLEDETRALGLPTRLTSALVDAASGLQVRNVTYRPIADVSDQVASRDLKLAVDARLLVARGEKRRRSYIASPALEVIRDRVQEPPGGGESFSDRGF
jgi:Fic family protein